MEFAHRAGQPAGISALNQFVEQNSSNGPMPPQPGPQMPSQQHHNMNFMPNGVPNPNVFGPGAGFNPAMARNPNHMNGAVNAMNHFGGPTMNGNLGLPGPGNAMASPSMRGGSPGGHPNMHPGMPMAQPMMAQHSQQGNSSSATASSSASPNTSGKKRRASAVKMEGGPDDSIAVNGIGPQGPDGPVKTKSTPKLGSQKKQKVNPA